MASFAHDDSVNGMAEHTGRQKYKFHLHSIMTENLQTPAGTTSAKSTTLLKKASAPFKRLGGWAGC